MSAEKKKLVKKAVKRRSKKPLDPLTAFLETVTAYYKDDSLAPGLTLAILPYKNIKFQLPAKNQVATIWYGSLNRYVKEPHSAGIKRLTYYKNTGASMNEVLKKIANAWYKEVMAPTVVLRVSRLKETL
jgi:hypothetical protein